MYLNGGQRFNLVYFVSFFFVSDNMTGSHSLYTIYEGHEVMFHVSTMLPFTPDNPQQVTCVQLCLALNVKSSQTLRAGLLLILR